MYFKNLFWHFPGRGFLLLLTQNDDEITSLVNLINDQRRLL
jgi:hypothetical protein